jgi:hypothetical protein
LHELDFGLLFHVTCFPEKLNIQVSFKFITYCRVILSIMFCYKKSSSTYMSFLSKYIHHDGLEIMLNVMVR